MTMILLHYKGNHRPNKDEYVREEIAEALVNSGDWLYTSDVVTSNKDIKSQKKQTNVLVKEHIIDANTHN